MIPTGQEVEALMRLHKDVELAPFVDWLRNFRAEIYSRMELTEHSERLHGLRGQAHVLSYILKSIEESREASDRLDAARKARAVTPTNVGY